MTNPAQRIVETIFLAIYHTACRIYRPVRGLAGAMVLTVFVAMTATVVMVFPVSNWDMFAYTAIILEPEVPDHVERHQKSYDIVRENVSPGEYKTLTEDREYRIRQAQDPDAFQTMMGFYRLKLLYIKTARILDAWMNPVMALRAISMGSALAVGGLLLFWLWQNSGLMYGPVVTALLVLSAFGASAQLLSPDLYASVFLILAALIYVNRLDFPAAAALFLAFLVRPDHLAFIGVFFVFAMVYGPGRWSMSLCFGLCLASYIILTGGSDHPGWWIHMWFTHVEYVPTLEGFNPDFSILAYAKMLVRSTARSLMNQTWLALLFAQVMFFAMVIDPARMAERSRVMLYAVFTSICAKYLVFPHFETRFYFAYLVIMGMILLLAWDRQRADAAGETQVLSS